MSDNMWMCTLCRATHADDNGVGARTDGGAAWRWIREAYQHKCADAHATAAGSACVLVTPAQPETFFEYAPIPVPTPEHVVRSVEQEEVDRCRCSGSINPECPLHAGYLNAEGVPLVSSAQLLTDAHTMIMEASDARLPWAELAARVRHQRIVANAAKRWCMACGAQKCRRRHPSDPPCGECLMFFLVVQSYIEEMEPPQLAPTISSHVADIQSALAQLREKFDLTPTEAVEALCNMHVQPKSDDSSFELVGGSSSSVSIEGESEQPIMETMAGEPVFATQMEGLFVSPCDECDPSFGCFDGSQMCRKPAPPRPQHCTGCKLGVGGHRDPACRVHGDVDPEALDDPDADGVYVPEHDDLPDDNYGSDGSGGW